MSSNPWSAAVPQRLETQLIHNAKLDIDVTNPFHRKTGIICTIGPKTQSVAMCKELIVHGMNIARLNFSHGSHEYHAETIANVRQAAKELGDVIVGIALDTKGPEIRTGLIKNPAGGNEVTLEKGKPFRLSFNDADHGCGDATKVWVDYKNMPKVVGKGSLIYIDDGLIALEVIECGTDWIDTTVINTGKLSDRKGVNLPNTAVDLPAVSEKDKADLRFGVEQKVDMIFASFIRKAADVQGVRDALGPEGKNIMIISKIENHEGVKRFDEVLDVTDGVMVARGDLGIEIPAEKVFLAQKMMISKCQMRGKPIICATQMLETMTTNPRPTRAEVSDVANAVLDGADCVMLSGETAKGAYPTQTVDMMSKICRDAEMAINYDVLYNMIKDSTPECGPDESVACAAVKCATEQNAKAIITMTTSGRTARLLAKYRPACPILPVSKDERSARQLHLSRGCYPLFYPGIGEHHDQSATTVERINYAMKVGKERSLFKPGDFVVTVYSNVRNFPYADIIHLTTVP